VSLSQINLFTGNCIYKYLCEITVFILVYEVTKIKNAIILSYSICLYRKEGKDYYKKIDPDLYKTYRRTDIY